MRIKRLRRASVWKTARLLTCLLTRMDGDDGKKASLILYFNAILKYAKSILREKVFTLFLDKSTSTAGHFAPSQNNSAERQGTVSIAFFKIWTSNAGHFWPGSKWPAFEVDLLRKGVNTFSRTIDFETIEDQVRGIKTMYKLKEAYFYIFIFIKKRRSYSRNRKTP